MSRRYLLAATRGVVILGLMALTLSGEIGHGYLIGAWVALVAGFFLDRFPAFQTSLRQTETPVVVMLIVMMGLDFFVQRLSIFLTIAHFLMLFQIFKCLGLKERKDCLQMLLFGFFQILAACTLSIDVGEGLMLLLFVPLATIGFFWNQVEWERERSGLPFAGKAERPYRWVTLILGVGALPVNLLLMISVFIFFPRLTFNITLPGVGNNNFGYSRQIDLSQTGQLQASDTPVLWLQFQSDIEKDLWNGYLRGDTLETFDGRQWAPAIPSPVRLLSQDLKGVFHPAIRRDTVPLVHGIVTLVHPSGSTLFVPGRAIDVIAPVSSLLQNPDGSLHTSTPIRKPIRYDVTSEIETASNLLPNNQIPLDDLRLPVLTFTRTQAFAQEVAGNGPPDERARRIENYLRTHYHYSLRLADAQSAPSANPLEDFLFVRRQGPCSYFASAMAVMLRLQGIPSRIVAGYLRGEWNEPAGQYLIRDSDAHAWVEAYIPGAGWQMFDPSPREAPPAITRGFSAATLFQYWEYFQLQWNHLVIDYDLYSQLRALEKLQDVGQPLLDRWGSWRQPWRHSGAKETTPSAQRTEFPWGKGLLGVVVVASFIMMGLNRRKHMLLHPNNAVRTYQEFLNRMARAGVPKNSSETGWEYTERLKKSQPLLQETAQRVTHTYYAARFSGRVLLLVLTLSILGLPFQKARAADPDATDIKSLISNLNSSDDDQREHAVDILKGMGPAAAPAIPALRKALNDDLPYVRTHAAEALTAIGAPAVAALTDALNKGSADVRAIAATSLGHIGSDAAPAIPSLVKALKDSDSTLRSNASTALIRIGGDAPTAVIALFKDDSPNTRLIAVRTVGSMNTNDSAVVTALMGCFSDNNMQVRLAAIKALGHRGAAVVPALIDGLQSGEPAVREQSCMVLADIGHKSSQAVPALTTLLKDSDASVRGAAATALGKIGSAAQPAVPALQELTKDSNASVATKAQEALTNISALFEQQNSAQAPSMIPMETAPSASHAASSSKTAKKKSTPAHGSSTARSAVRKPVKVASTQKVPPAVTQLIKQLENVDDDVVRLEASQKLTAMGAGAVGGLINAVNHSTITVRVQATTILGQIGLPAAPALPTLTDNLRSPALELRQPSAISMLQIDSMTAFTTLTNIAKEDPDQQVRINVIQVLGQVGAAGAPAVPALIEVLKDSDTVVGSKASMALTQIGTPDATTAVKLYDRQQLSKQVQDIFKTLRKNAPTIDNKSVDELVNMGIPAVPVMATGLKDPNPTVRGGVARALNRFGKDAAAATQPLIDALDDTDATVRKEASETLGKIDSPQAQSALRFFPEKDWYRGMMEHFKK